MEPQSPADADRPGVLVSVLVPTRGGRQRLTTLLGRLEAQDEQRFEVVVVIDGDVDDSEGMLRRRVTGVPLQVVTFPENRGRSAALNAGLAAARGRVLVRCDDDLEPGPDFVRRHLGAHEGREVGVVGLYRNTFPDTPYARAYGRHADEHFRDAAYRAPADATWRYWAGNASVTRETAELVGGYDEAFRAYGWEDVDWGLRLHRSGVPVVLDRALETTHRLSAVTARSRVERAFFSGAARRQFVAKHGMVDLVPPAPHSPWTRAVALVARGLSESRARSAGRAADALARVLPSRASRTLVGLLVEAASEAGYRRGSVADPTAV